MLTLFIYLLTKITQLLYLVDSKIIHKITQLQSSVDSKISRLLSSLNSTSTYLL